MRTEQNRLNYHKQHQTALRAEKYKVLVDYMTGDDNTRIGRRIILPATFPGSPRYMVGLYQDSMSIVAKFGKPDEFITFTCNPNWTEITENLFEHQSPSDRPDLISRVFRAKQAEFLDDLIKKGVKGKVKAYMWVIEFQKRGLPHCHLLLCYEDDDKIRTPEQLDQSISAVIPNPRDTQLHDVITKFNLHGKCGSSNIQAPCMDLETSK